MDIKQGTEGVVEGFADAENRKLLIKVLLTEQGSGAPREVVHEACPRNVELRSPPKKSIESLLAAGGPHEQAASAGGQKRGTNWLLQGSPPELVNRKAVKAHERLVVFQELASKEVHQEGRFERKNSTDP